MRIQILGHEDATYHPTLKEPSVMEARYLRLRTIIGNSISVDKDSREPSRVVIAIH